MPARVAIKMLFVLMYDLDFSNLFVYAYAYTRARVSI